MRRLFFGGRPIIAGANDQSMRKLQRLGGLRKHHFRVVKRTGHLAPLSEPAPGNPARHRSPERTTMIVKKLKRTSFKKSRSVMIGGLVDYILAGHDDRGKDKHTITEAQIF